jgi:hypothetical protein
MNDNAKTYEDGVRDGFEACRKAAEAVCRKRGLLIMEWSNSLPMTPITRAEHASLRDQKQVLNGVTRAIAALTPESPND